MRMQFKLGTFVSLVALQTFSELPSAASDFTYQIVAQSGSNAPGTGASFYSFDSGPAINNQGQVIFSANVSNAVTQGIWAGSPGHLSLVAVEHGNAPGIPGVQFDSFGNALANLTLADDGRILLMAKLKNGGVGPGNDTAMYVGLPGALQLVMREGAPAPGTALNFIEPSSIGVSDFYGAWLRENGVFAFGGRLDGVVTPSNDQRGLWQGTPGALQPVVLAGQSTAHGSIISTKTGQSAAGLRQDGTLYFSAATGSAMSGVWHSGAGGPTRLVVQGGLAPGTGLIFSTATDHSFPTVAFFEPNRLYFPGTLATGGGAITNGEFFGTPDTVDSIFVPGTAAPEIGGTLVRLHRAIFNTNDGILAFAVLAAGGGVGTTNDQVIYHGTAASPTTWKLVMREGSSTPIDAAVRFDIGPVPDHACFNGAGTVAFYNRLAGAGVGSTNRDSLWMWTPSSQQPALVARGGDPIDFGGGVVKTPLYLSFRGGDGRAGGLTSGLNEKGQMVFEAYFSDFTEAIVLATPRPKLTITRGAGQIGISWPDTFANYQLQQADSLSAPIAWANTTNAAVQSGGKFTVTINPVEARKYYRLIQ